MFIPLVNSVYSCKYPNLSILKKHAITDSFFTTMRSICLILFKLPVWLLNNFTVAKTVIRNSLSYRLMKPVNYCNERKGVREPFDSTKTDQ